MVDKETPRPLDRDTASENIDLAKCGSNSNSSSSDGENLRHESLRRAAEDAGDDREFFKQNPRRRYRLRYATPAEVAVGGKPPGPNVLGAIVLVEQVARGVRIRVAGWAYGAFSPTAINDQNAKTVFDLLTRRPG